MKKPRPKRGKDLPKVILCNKVRGGEKEATPEFLPQEGLTCK